MAQSWHVQTNCTLPASEAVARGFQGTLEKTLILVQCTFSKNQIQKLFETGGSLEGNACGFRRVRITVIDYYMSHSTPDWRGFEVTIKCQLGTPIVLTTRKQWFSAFDFKLEENYEFGLGGAKSLKLFD